MMYDLVGIPDWHVDQGLLVMAEAPDTRSGLEHHVEHEWLPVAGTKLSLVATRSWAVLSGRALVNTTTGIWINSYAEQRMALVLRDRMRYKLFIAGHSETRFSEQGQLEKVGACFTFFWSGGRKRERRDAGFAFAIGNDIV
ncbi:unnamed protein product [Schistocephalus solidus]|uniref:Metallo-beta-lactamase superfamily protein n=1 Tax=Schistocephalus solidus TaxID=70667 RepID=A0A183SJW5_SCHSO|nr:unnamed protein product [Schistocephalus solidus]